MTETNPASGAAGSWEIACDATLQAVVESAGCAELFRRTLTGSVSWQVRNRTTTGRVLTTPSAALSWFAALLALGAEVSVEGQGHVPVHQFLERRIKGRLQTLHVPVLGCDGTPLRGICWGEARVARTPSDEPIVSAVAAVEGVPSAITRARLALTGVWARPVAMADAASLLVGGRLTAGRIRDVAAKVEAEVAPKGDFLGSAEYRRAMAGVMARRALEECLKGQCTEYSDGEAGHGRKA
jgi:carbon-monoxide dehydrogenase medium subunit